MARNNTRAITLTDIELGMIERAAKKTEKSIAAFIRESAVEATKKVTK